MKYVIICLMVFMAYAQGSVDLDKLRAEAKAKGWTFEIGKTSVTDLDLEVITGAIEPPNWKDQVKFINKVTHPYLLPEVWDSRVELGELTPSVRAQGSCGSCWAFGSTAAFEFSYLKYHLDTMPLILGFDLSEQEMVSCSSHGSCRGGWYAHKWQVSPGQALEADFPYVARDVRCKQNLEPGAIASEYFFLGSKNRKPTVVEIKKAIFEYGAVSTVVRANGAMQAYKGGIFNGCSSWSINHLVALVGWDGKGNWIMRNSWGTNWGEDNGYMRMPYGCSSIGKTAAYVVYKPIE